MRPAPPHSVPVGPLAVRWLGYEVPEPRAGALGTALVALENAGSATWRSRGAAGIQLAHHWLDDRGNPIVWDGLRTAFEHPVEPGEQVELAVTLRGPNPPGRYRLAFDLLEEGRFWLAELGNAPLEVPVDVRPRLEERALAVRLRPDGGSLAEATRAALARQEEPVVAEPEAAAIAHLAPGCLPAPDWSRRLLDAHQEGYAAVGGSLEPVGSWRERRRARALLAPWSPGSGRNPSFPHPLLCPSLTIDAEARWLPDLLGLPAVEPSREPPPRGEPWTYDGRIRLGVTPPPRSGRPRG